MGYRKRDKSQIFRCFRKQRNRGRGRGLDAKRIIKPASSEAKERKMITIKTLRKETGLTRNALCTRADNLEQTRHYETDPGTDKSYRVFTEQEKHDIIHYMEIR